jgi:hypothetical protein
VNGVLQFCALRWVEIRRLKTVEKDELLLKKAAIIARTHADMRKARSHEGLRRYSEPEEAELAVRTLEAKLSEIEPDRDIRTCSDLSHLHAKCCEICHDLSPHYEMSLLDLEGACKAWVCCALDRALNPRKDPQLTSSAANKTLAAILGWINYDQ